MRPGLESTLQIKRKSNENKRNQIVGAKMYSVQPLFFADFIAKAVFFNNHAKKVK